MPIDPGARGYTSVHGEWTLEDNKSSHIWKASAEGRGGRALETEGEIGTSKQQTERTQAQVTERRN